VIATSFWAAKKARDKVKVVWDDAEGAKINSDVQRSEYLALAKTPGTQAKQSGDPNAIKSAAKTIVAEYDVPYLAHAPMEPLNWHRRIDGRLVQDLDGHAIPDRRSQCGGAGRGAQARAGADHDDAGRRGIRPACDAEPPTTSSRPCMSRASCAVP